MKANQSLRRDAEAVTVAIGAILLVTILFIVMLVVQSSFVPRWEEEAEERHVRLAQREFLDVVTQMEQRASNSSAASASYSLSMNPGGGIMSSGPKLPGEVTTTSVPSGSTFSATELSLAIEDGSNVVALNENWISITGTHSVNDIARLDHLRIRVFNPMDEAEGEFVDIDITDANGDPAGTLKLYIDKVASEYAVLNQVYAPSGTLIYESGEFRKAKSGPIYHWVDALDPSMMFQSLLKAAEWPIGLDLTESGLTAQMAIYGVNSDDSPVDGASPGKTIAPLSRTDDAGRLSFEIPNQQFPAQTLIMDHGAVVIRQADGVAFLEVPAFEVGPLSTLTKVTITDTVAGGTAKGIASHAPVRVTLSSAATDALTGTSPDATWNITTPFPGLWSAHWDDVLSGQGWDDSAGHYSITSGADWARLELIGLDPGTDHDLLIRWTHASITTILET